LLNIGGSPSHPIDDNLKIYMGWSPEPVVDDPTPQPVIISSGIYMDYTFPLNYDGYSVTQLLADNPTLLSIIDTENKVYMYYRMGVPAVMTSYIDATKTYIIEVQ
jgi:hypothetical protein